MIGLERLRRTAIACGMALAAIPLGVGRAPAEEPYPLHAILPLTGSAAFLGQSVQRAMQAVETALNHEGGVHGRPVHFIFHDDQSSPQVAVQVATQVLATHPVAVFGSAISAMCNAMAPLMQNGPVLYCLSPAVHPKPGSFEFTASVAQDDYFLALMRYAHQRGWRRIALLTTTDASGQDADRGVTEVMRRPENADLQLVAHEHFNPSDISIAAQVEHIRAARPDLLIGWAAGATVGSMFRGLSQAGFDIPVAASTSSMTYAQMAAFAGVLPPHLYYASTPWVAEGDPRVALPAATKRQLEIYFRAATAAGWKPDAASETGWDPPRIVVHALNALPADAGAAALRDAMSRMSGFAGIDGTYDFAAVPQRGLDPDSTIVTRWDAAARHWTPVTGPGGAKLPQRAAADGAQDPTWPAAGGQHGH